MHKMQVAIKKGFKYIFGPQFNQYTQITIQINHIICEIDKTIKKSQNENEKCMTRRKYKPHKADKQVNKAKARMECSSQKEVMITLQSKVLIKS